jgi:hypothetical protein
LIGKSLVRGAPPKHFEVRGRQADVDSSILSQIALGGVNGILPCSFLILDGSELAALISGDQPALLVIVQDGILHFGSPFARFLVALRLGYTVLRNRVRPGRTTGTT